MAYQFDVNNPFLKAAVGYRAMFVLKNTFLTAGWDIPRSGNGSVWAEDLANTTLDNAAAVDAGGGVVTLPCTGNSLVQGQRVVISGTTNYDGTYWTDAVAANTFDIVEAFTAETFTGAEVVQRIGDVIEAYGDLNNANSWFVARGAGGTREWLFAMNNDSDDCDWYIGYSWSAGFTGGGVTTTLPSATDQANMCGTPLSVEIALFVTENQVVHVMVDDASDAFYVVGCRAGGRPSGLIFSDPVTNHNVSDLDPVVMGGGSCGSYSMFSTNSSGRGFYSYGPLSRAWVALGEASEVFGTMPACMVTAGDNGSAVFPHDGSTGVGQDLYTGDDQGFPVIYARSSNYVGTATVKGFSSIFRAIGTGRGSCTTLDVDGVRDWLMSGTTGSYPANVAFPWDGSVPTVI